MMDHLWKNFIKAFNGKIQNENLEFVYIAKEYTEKFSKEMEISTEQKDLMGKLLSVLLGNKETADELFHYMGFLFPLDKIDAAKTVHEKVSSQLNKLKISTMREQIIESFQQNFISVELFHYIKENQRSKDSLIFILAFSYLANELKTMFTEQRKELLSFYQTHFRTHSYSIPKIWFITTDTESLRKYSAIERNLETNPLLSLSFTIAAKQNNPSVADFIENIGEIYEELRSTYSLLYDLVAKSKEEEHANC